MRRFARRLDARKQRRGSAAWRLGFDAEALAAGALEAEGWRVLARRARTAAGELDLVAATDAVLAFVEVKARPSLREAAHAVTPRQQSRLYAAAEAWLAANPQHARGETRFDVMLVAADGTVRRIKDAIRG